MKKDCFKGRFCSKAGFNKIVILNLIQDLQRGLLLFVNDMRGRCQIKFGMTSLYNNNAFTLIELLVVVLIIGILAAVALPQYQKAVSKARLQKLLPLVSAIDHAEQVYFLANGTYTADYTQLDIQMPTPDSEVENKYSGKDLFYKDFLCRFLYAGEEYSMRCYPTNGEKIPEIEKKFALPYFSCLAGKNSTLLNSVCASIPATKDETYNNVVYNNYLF